MAVSCLWPGYTKSRTRPALQRLLNRQDGQDVPLGCTRNDLRNEIASFQWNLWQRTTAWVV
ncbi:hypothetical protein XAP6164_810011 [Xanthomonas phaseoli pv. phaseoli]|nr:hypothetical protein DGM93_09475 [Xanthomonas phaseoli pv. phaseoli]QWN32898.1 hypothetical protein DGM81_09495 [Xanthomonas phaseoli pv. phaseoli]SOO32137.1 hypothetical protein XAP6164_810011 [Xanthomonas phaseoli pv. phaseoli]